MLERLSFRWLPLIGIEADLLTLIVPWLSVLSSSEIVRFLPCQKAGTALEIGTNEVARLVVAIGIES